MHDCEIRQTYQNDHIAEIFTILYILLYDIYEPQSAKYVPYRW